MFNEFYIWRSIDMLNQVFLPILDAPCQQKGHFHRTWHTNAQCHMSAEKITEINILKLIKTKIRLLTFNFSQDFDAQINLLFAAELNADSKWLEYAVSPGETQLKALHSHHQEKGAGGKAKLPRTGTWKGLAHHWVRWAVLAGYPKRTRRQNGDCRN